MPLANADTQAATSHLRCAPKPLTPPALAPILCSPVVRDQVGRDSIEIRLPLSLRHWRCIQQPNIALLQDVIRDCLVRRDSTDVEAQTRHGSRVKPLELFVAEPLALVWCGVV